MGELHVMTGLAYVIDPESVFRPLRISYWITFQGFSVGVMAGRAVDLPVIGVQRENKAPCLLGLPHILENFSRRYRQVVPADRPARERAARVWLNPVTTEADVVERIRHVEVDSEPAPFVLHRHARVAKRARRLCRITRFHRVRIQLFVAGCVMTLKTVLTLFA